MTSLNLILHVCETRKFVMAILHWKQGLLCDKSNSLSNPYKAKQTMERLNFEALYFFISFKNVIYPFPKRQILEASKLKQFADDNFKFEETGRKTIQMGRKHCGKRRNCSLRAISPFPTVFSKDMYCRHVKTRGCLGKG